jgi:hypothetical protein
VSVIVDNNFISYYLLYQIKCEYIFKGYLLSYFSIPVLRGNIRGDVFGMLESHY